MADQTELTKSDILSDPLIKQVMDADGVSSAELSALMDEVSARLANGRERSQRWIARRPPWTTLPRDTSAFRHRR